MNDSEALLIVERGPVPATQFPLHHDQLTIGRSTGNDVVLADPEVSRRHARLLRRADGYAVEDAGSTNGTFVNGQRISHLTLLQDGDTIDLGDTVRLRYMAMLSVSPGNATPVSERPTQSFAPVAPPATPNTWPPSAFEPAYADPAPADYSYQLPPTYATEAPRRGRGLLIGCGLLVALLLVCAGTFLVLDAYDQGRLLYCGALAPFFETILGPFGFAPICP